MLKKLFLITTVVSLLLCPVVSHAMDITMPYFKITGGKKIIRHIPIQLPLEVTEDFTKWPALLGARQGELELLPDMLKINDIVGRFVFTDKESKTSYTLYVYCRAPLVLGLKRQQGTTSSYWKYVDKKPIKVTEKSFSVFLISATYAKEM